ncbi:hypothetical protein H072_5194 [Dactylellina haptotyla CBS 200.50]|uniref:Uncharacterized protein n=1 Tax=Dactylellina haptotyla (strain CBS 200.50) TaxID=1284197 RepID=S8AIH7_DACHA|nr:hypothetical protein H072_5194 [Dactylellina haptotyla CBS 200.50]
MSYSLYLVTYTRGTDWQTHRTKAYHWAFLIEIDHPKCIKHQLRGMPGGYYYPGPEDADASNEEPGQEMKATPAHQDTEPTPERPELADEEAETDGASAQLVVSKLEIGSIKNDKDTNVLQEFEDACRKVYIEKDENKGGEGQWNCQKWCLEVLEELRAKGLGKDIWYGGTEIQEWLKEKA